MSKDGGSKQATAEKRLIEKDPQRAISSKCRIIHTSSPRIPRLNISSSGKPCCQSMIPRILLINTMMRNKL